MRVTDGSSLRWQWEDWLLLSLGPRPFLSPAEMKEQDAEPPSERQNHQPAGSDSDDRVASDPGLGQHSQVAGTRPGCG